MSFFEDTFKNNTEAFIRALNRLSDAELDHGWHLLKNAAHDGDPIYLIGNGGSAAIANHFETDFAKGSATSTWVKPQARSLASNQAIITAYGNDVGYSEIFRQQINNLPAGLVIAISSSGNSPNIINAISATIRKRGKVIAITGFKHDNEIVSKFRTFKDVASIHIDSSNYGVVEDVTSFILHSYSQSLRKYFANDKNEIPNFTF